MSKLYVVQRRTWFDDYKAYDDGDCIKGGGVPVAAFGTRKAATAHAQQLEKQAREEASSPFLLLNGETYEYRLKLTDEEMCKAIRDLGLEPPEEIQARYGKYRPWPRWYDELAEKLTPAQRNGIWRLFSKLKVYEVVEVQLED
jgi:hypothetical protein